MTKQWYVLQTLTGQEQKAKRSIEARIQLEGMDGLIGDVLIPTEKVTEVKGGVKRTITRKFFPGYVFINLVLYDDNHNVLERTWRFLKDTSGVIGFVGGENPTPLAEAEIEAIINQMEGKKETETPRVVFEPGEKISIIDGPFMNFDGTVDEVDPNRGKLKVTVAIFGRDAPVELEYWQVERKKEEDA